MTQPATAIGSSSPDGAAFVERLAYYRGLTHQALKDRLPSKEPRRYLYDLVSGCLDNSGKGLRPALCLATCQAFGGRLENALDSAAALEIGRAHV